MKIFTSVLLILGVCFCSAYANFDPNPELQKEDMEIFILQDKWLSIQLSKFYTAYLEENFDEMGRLKELIDDNLREDIGKHLGKNSQRFSNQNFILNPYNRFRPPLNEK